MEDLVRHVLLALALLGLGHAGLRAASRISPSGLERAVVAAVFAVGAAVVQALVLGLVGLGANPVALCTATALTWAAATVLLPPPEVRPLDDVARWWGGLPRPGRIAFGALSGAAGGWVVWQLLNPAIGFDGSVYHYAEVAGWIANGRPGSILTLSYDLPYGNYPVTDEVALTWLAGIARSWVPLSLWNPAMLGLLVAATVVTLRNLKVRRPAMALATTALAASPMVVRQLNEPQTDVPTVAWLACTAALATGAARRPALLAPAVVAAGLAVGTKTTSAGMVAAALAVGLVLARGRLRPLAGWLALALAAAVAVGGVWYLRNLVDHGSPLWPFTAAPWGDPRPRFLELIDTSLAERPLGTLDGRLDDYSARLGGVWLLVVGAAGALVLGILMRRRQLGRMLLVAGGVAMLGTLLWSLAPGTGEQTAPGQLLGSGWPIATARYILPAAFAAAVAAALATRAPGRAGVAALGLLALAAVWSLAAAAREDQPWVPPAGPLLAGAAAGMLALAAATLLAGRITPRASAAAGARAGAATVAVAVGLGALATPAGNGFVARHAEVDNSSALGRHVAGWFAARPGFDDGDGDVHFVSRSVLAPLAGDHFTHRLRLVAPDASCGAVRAIAVARPVVLTEPNFLRGFLGSSPYSAGHCLSGRTPDFRDPAYRVYAP